MKKLLSLIAIAAFGLSTAFAQTPATTTATTKKVVKKEVKSAGAPTKVAIKKVETKSTTAGVKLKADGTPDKRYKTATVAGPTKKDGTADMRYKANKTTTTTKKVVKKN